MVGATTKNNMSQCFEQPTCVAATPTVTVWDKLGRRWREYRHLPVRSARRLRYLVHQRRAGAFSLEFSDGLAISLYPEGVGAERLCIGLDRPSEFQTFTAFLRPRNHVVDVGANIGVYSLLAAKAVGPQGKVWAFEPSSESYSRLLRNLALNSADCVVTKMVALADKVGRGEIRRDPGFRDGDRYLGPLEPLNQAQRGAEDREEVGVTTLDRFAEENAGARQVDFLKIDVEGAEYFVLQGARSVLECNEKIVVMFECQAHHTARMGHSQLDVYRFLQGFGFGLYCWSDRTKCWSGEVPALLASKDVWACRDSSMLPDC